MPADTGKIQLFRQLTDEREEEGLVAHEAFQRLLGMNAQPVQLGKKITLLH